MGQQSVHQGHLQKAMDDWLVELQMEEENEEMETSSGMMCVRQNAAA
jgi:hypothetical protein